MAEHHDSVRHHKQNRYSLLQSSRRFSTTTRCRLSYLQQFRGSQQPFSSKPWKLGLTEEDAAIFFGRDAQVLRGLDRLRLMRDAGVERMLVVLGASGAGKSSFL